MSDDRLVLVSGGRSGIGAAVARDLLAQGWQLAIADIKPPEPGGGNLDELALPPCDVSDEDSVATFFEALQHHRRQVDALVHCAGIYPGSSFAETDFALWRQVLATNLDSLFLLASQVLPGMQKRGWGRLVALSSNTFFDATPGLAAYIASKAGMIGLIRAIAREYGPHGVTANALAPSITRTATTESVFAEGDFAALVAKQAIPRLAQPSDYLGTIRFLLSQDSAFMTGQTLIVDGGWTRN